MEMFIIGVIGGVVGALLSNSGDQNAPWRLRVRRSVYAADELVRRALGRA
jgi:hypothetical protein